MKISLHNCIIALLFIILFTTPSEAKLEVQREVLPGGLVVLTAPKHNLPVVVVSLGIKAATSVESPEKAGLANLTAELLTEGTKNRTSVEISEELDFMGASLNASTGRDLVTVNLSVLKKDVDKCFDILSDVIKNPLFKEEEISKLKTRIIGTIKSSEEDPEYVAAIALRNALFTQANPYGRPVTGTKETVSNLTREDVSTFHNIYYRPDKTIITIVGDIYPEERDRLIKKYFGDWKLLANSPPPPALPEPHSPDKRKIVKIERELTQATVIMGYPGLKRDNPDYYAVVVMNHILGSSGFSSRLMKNIRQDKGLVYGVFSYFAPAKEKGLFAVSLQTKNESANQAISEVISELKGIQNKPVSDQELSDAHSYLTGSFPMQLETNRKIASFLVAMEFHGLGLDYIYRYPELITSITKEDIQRAAQKYLHPDNLTIVVVADQEKAKIRGD